MTPTNLETWVALITAAITAYGMYQKNKAEHHDSTLNEYKELYKVAKAEIKEDAEKIDQLEEKNEELEEKLNLALEKIDELEAIIKEMEANEE
ncbi:MAG: hypothetical protein F6I01_002100 [Aerococcus sanguinicola]